MEKRKILIKDASQIVRESADNSIYYVGPKPWYQRALSKSKFGLTMGLATGLISGLSAFGVVNIHELAPNFTTDLFKTEAVQSSVTPKVIHIKKIITESPEVPSSLVQLKKDNPEIDFGGIENTRDVSKQFLGKNNFIALAAEMEGFRGDLHKDPAVGLNIGFGYNISKRVDASKGEVVKDLLSIGVDNDKIKKIVEISQKPQKDLTKEITAFNKEYKIEKNQLITIEQGVALLSRTQKEYRGQAKASFPGAFDKMGKNQQEILTYAAYKAGYEALSKFKKAVKAADVVYSKKTFPGFPELKSIAKELSFYYRKDGKEMVLDERASLIAHTFVSQDYLGIQIGKTDGLKQTSKKLAEQKIDFSKVALNISDKEKTKDHVSNVLEKFRENKVEAKHKFKAS